MRTPTPKKSQDTRGYWRVSYYKEGKRKYEHFGRGPVGRKLAEKFLADKTQEFYNRDLGLLKEVGADDFFLQYLEYSEVNKAKRTYQRDAAIIERFLPHIKDKKLTEITITLLEKYKTERAKVVEKATVNREFGTLKAAFNKAVEWELLQKSPAQKIKKFKVGKKDPRFFSHEEIAAFLAKIDNQEVKAAIILLLTTGMRRDEFLHLEWDNVDLKRNVIYVRPKADWHPKNHEFRVIPIGPQAKEALLSFPKKDKKIWTLFTDQSTLSKVFQKALKKANIENARLHDLRHTYASHLVMNGTDLATVKELLGHKDIQTTMIYAHLSHSHKVDAVKNLSKIFYQFSITSPVNTGNVVDIEKYKNKGKQ